MVSVQVVLSDVFVVAARVTVVGVQVQVYTKLVSPVLLGYETATNTLSRVVCF